MGANLIPEHLAMLREGSAICDEVIAARGYRTVTWSDELAAYGFPPKQRRPGLLIPVHTTDGQIGLYVLRPDRPREIPDKKNGHAKVVKYEVPRGTATRVDCPPACRADLANPSVPLWVTEGIKKADCLASRGLCAIGLLGVCNFRGKNDVGGVVLLADFDYVALNGRDVRIVFDSDVMTKLQVRQALDRLIEHIQRKGAHVSVAYLPNGPDGSKVGVDDWFAGGHSVDELESLIESPRQSVPVAASLLELLDEAPATIRRPLTLIDGRACAAFWPHVRTTRTEEVDRKSGEVRRLDPPRVETSRRLFVMRDDGELFGDGPGDGSYRPLSDLGLEVRLLEAPPSERLWTTPGVKRYRGGHRPDPAEVFLRVVGVIDRFIDFSRSLADQRTMCEMISCYVLATWFLDAFSVIGFLWPTGDRGTGKTQLIDVVCQLSYLGQVILAGGSYASLRDLADYGACLGFDDAEGLADAKKIDPDKRALLLAGNRKGSTVPLKELAGDKTWRTRYVNTFCPRLFSAIGRPDPVLGSRAIMVPLIRTNDRDKANADPQDHTKWPHDARKLTDDLWALALANLPTVGYFEQSACDDARIAGRSLDTWRAILTVAKWLEAKGVGGVYSRLEALSYDYQAERPDLETSDLTALTIKALLNLFAPEEPRAESLPIVERVCAASARDLRYAATYSSYNMSSRDTPLERGVWAFHPSTVCGEVKRLIADEGDDASWVNNWRIGKAMSRLRFAPGREDGGRRQRVWIVRADELRAMAETYGLTIPDPLISSGVNVRNGVMASIDAGLLPDRGYAISPFTPFTPFDSEDGLNANDLQAQYEPGCLG